mmetsp:Transcript_99532/g.160492  ORF Transcript_99532/g.160492 Transcript_99532/m.160492 type:complete len:83 (-) Transcript_99532:319-567(-)
MRATASGKARTHAVTQVQKKEDRSGEEGGGQAWQSSVVRGFAGEPLLDLSFCDPQVPAARRSGVKGSKLHFPVSPLFLAAGP